MRYYYFLLSTELFKINWSLNWMFLLVIYTWHLQTSCLWDTYSLDCDKFIDLLSSFSKKNYVSKLSIDLNLDFLITFLFLLDNEKY